MKIDYKILSIGNFSLGTPFNADFSSSNLQYIILNNQLQRYNPIGLSYISLMALPPWNNYFIYNHENRLVVVGYNTNSSNVSGVTTYTLSYTFYVMIDGNSQISMIDTFSVNVKTSYASIPIIISPNLSKIYYQYTIQGTNTPISVLKAIDYINMYVFDVDLSSYSSTFSIIK
jgi:hypothetical protein